MTNIFPGPGVRLLRGRGQWLPAVPRVLPRGLPWRSGGNDQVELHLPQRDDIRPGNPVNIKVALHMKISQSARLFICNFKSESSPVIVQLIHQADGRTIKWAPWKNVLFLVCNWIWPQCNELTSQYFSRIMMIYVCRSSLGGSAQSWKLLTMFFVFQAHLVCSFPLDAIPCEEAPNFYDGPDSLNARFGEKVSSDYDSEY